jgi:hypothetical protein
MRICSVKTIFLSQTSTFWLFFVQFHCARSHILTTPWDALRGGGVVCHQCGMAFVWYHKGFNFRVDESFVMSLYHWGWFQILSIGCLSNIFFCV